MLFEFKSRATGSVVMTADVGKKVLPLIGKSPDPQGIITVNRTDKTGDAVALEAACKRENQLAAAAKDKAKGAASQDAVAGGDDPEDDPHLIGICQRVYPLIEMLKEAHTAGKDITWGV